MKLDTMRHSKEVVLRGIYLSMATTVEWAALPFIAKLFKGRINELKIMYPDKKLHLYSLSERISCIKIGLEQHHKNLFEKHKKTLEKLHNLIDMRNKFGHGKIEWKGESLNTIFITIYKEDKLFKSTHNIDKLRVQLESYWNTVRSFLNLVDFFINNENK